MKLPGERMPDRRNKTGIMLLVMMVLTCMVVGIYHTSLTNDFINYDDNVYVYENPYLRNPGLGIEGIVWAFGSLRCSNWHPLTWLSHLIDVRLFGLAPAGHHLVNLLFHLVNTQLLFLFLRYVTGSLWRSAVVASLFALHPLHVESVAWVAERKDLLCTSFLLTAFFSYAVSVRRGCRVFYGAAVVAAVAALLAKPMAVTVAPLLLLIDFWPLRRLENVSTEALRREKWRLLVDKIPFLVPALIIGMVTLYAQKQGEAVDPVTREVMLSNGGNAFIAYITYLYKTLWPVGLGVFYPFDRNAVTVLRVCGSLLIIGVITVACLKERKRHPYLVWGWSWYLVALLPVIGFIHVGEQALADRYTYLPLTGIFVAIVWGGYDLAVSYNVRRWLLVSTTVTVLVLLSASTSRQLSHWRTSITLFTHTLEVAGDSWLAHNNLGIALYEQGRYREAADHYLKALACNGRSPLTYNNLGNVYGQLGLLPQAIMAFDKALRINPRYGDAYFNRGVTYVEMGELEHARSDLARLQDLHPRRGGELEAMIVRATGR
jgi:hypothetical protein